LGSTVFLASILQNIVPSKLDGGKIPVTCSRFTKWPHVYTTKTRNLLDALKTGSGLTSISDQWWVGWKAGEIPALPHDRVELLDFYPTNNFTKVLSN
jgi:hypothetical protein